MTDPSELIQRYIDQTISEPQLREFQELLKSDPAIRRDLLLYSRLDIAIQDFVLFHDYMDDPGTRDAGHENGSRQSKTEAESLDQLLRNVFSKRNPETTL